MNLLIEKKYGVPSRNFVKKNVLCEKGDKITQFDGTNITLTQNNKALAASSFTFTPVQLYSTCN
jgi:hypothetical protein